MNFKYFWLDLNQLFLNFYWVEAKKIGAIKKK